MEQLSIAWNQGPKVYTVSELNGEIRTHLARHFDDVRIAGEISGVKIPSSGHVYFTLKDAASQVKCVLYRSNLRYAKFKPADGLAVVARGSIDVWDARGEYQLVVTHLEPQGHGALQLAFEQLKKRLAMEGLFAPERKRPLPKYPSRIGIVTSPTGAVIRDMIHVLVRRSPGLHVRLFPTAVQGEGAAVGVCNGIDYFSKSGWAEVVIVGRGGGSLEDLWTFNEESVARAIARCSVPVVSAVGHETDFTISDLVADLRAPTPSAAAELVVPNRADLVERVRATTVRGMRALRLALATAARRLNEQGIERATALLHRRIGRLLQRTDDSESRLRARIGAIVEIRRRKWTALDRRLLQQDLRLRLGRARERLQNLEARRHEAIVKRLRRAQQRLEPCAARLEALSPLAILQRGYAIVQTQQGRVVLDPDQAPAGTEIDIRVARGHFGAVVKE